MLHLVLLDYNQTNNQDCLGLDHDYLTRLLDKLLIEQIQFNNKNKLHVKQIK